MTNKINKVIHNGTEFEFESANGGVTSVNGDTGAVTVNDVKKSATAPSSPTEGMLWYDTTNDQLKVYDGSQWNVTGKEYQAGTGINIANDTITNSGVTSVNGETGDVTIQSGSEASGVTTEQPSNPVAGSTYYDTTNNVLRIYDGTQWIDYGNPDLSNYLAKNNTTAFTPSGDYNPATKKYVDDHSGIINDTTGTTTTVQKIRAGSTTEYNAVTKQEGVIYHVYE